MGSTVEGDLYVADLATLVDDRADPRRWAAKEFNYIEISDIDSQTCVVYANCVDTTATPSRARKLVKAGDVLVSTVRPERGIVGVVGRHQDGCICTTGLAVLRPTAIDSLTLAFLLKTEFVIAQLLRNNVGIAYPAINENCLLGILLPIRRKDIQRIAREAKQIAAAEEQLLTLRASFKEAIGDAGDAWRQLGFAEDPKSHPNSQTMSRHQSHKRDSDSRDQDIFQLAASHKA